MARYEWDTDKWETVKEWFWRGFGFALGWSAVDFIIGFIYGFIYATLP